MYILICDDLVPYALALRENLAEIYKSLSMDVSFTVVDNLRDFVRCLESRKPDAVFLDIVMEGQSTIDWWLENIKAQNIRLVFMTSYPEEAYNLSQISSALLLVKARTDRAYLGKLVEKLNADTADPGKTFIAVKLGSTTHTIDTQKIRYIESFGNSLLIHLQDETVKIRHPIGSFSKRLPDNFLRIHKSYIVNMDAVIRTEPYQFVLAKDLALHVNPRKFSELEKQYRKYIALHWEGASWVR